MRHSVAIVGNGSSLLGSNNGKIIDACDRVIRMNDFELCGYSQSVGKKLDIYACGPQHVVKRGVSFLNEINEFWFPFPIPTEGEKGYFRYKKYNEAIKLIPNGKMICHLSNSKLGMLESEQKIFDEAIWCPSTSYRILEMALARYPKSKILVCGIDFFQGGWYWNIEKHWRGNPYLNDEQMHKVVDRHPIKYEEHMICSYANYGRIKLI